MISEKNKSKHSSLLVDEELINKREKERHAYIIGIVIQIFWASNVVQMKTFIQYFPEFYSDNSAIFWRMLIFTLIGYFLCIYKKVPIKSFSEIKNKKWFLLRNATSYIYITCWVRMYSYFRVSTISVIGSTAPLIIILLSVILIGEKFYMRYFFGVLLCIFGATLIILNDKKPESKSQILNDNLLVGILYSITNDSLFSISTIGQKVLTNEGMDADLQNYYFGLYNAVPAFIIFVISGEIKNINFRYILYVLYVGLNGAILYLYNYFMIYCLRYIAVSKYQPVIYLSIVFIFILSSIILGEHIFFTDIIGSLIIIGFQYYNLVYPPRKNLIQNFEKKSNII